MSSRSTYLHPPDGSIYDYHCWRERLVADCKRLGHHRPEPHIGASGRMVCFKCGEVEP